MGIMRHHAALLAAKTAGLRLLALNAWRLPLRASMAALLVAASLPSVQAASEAAPATAPGAIPATRAELAAPPTRTSSSTPTPADTGMPPLPAAKPVDPRAALQPAFAEPTPQPFAAVRNGRDTMPTTADNGAVVTGGRRQIFTFTQLGALDPLQLRGVDGQNGVPFSVRADEVVTGANLHLIYSYSPSLLSNLSHLKVLVNGEVAATLPLPREQAGTLLARDIPLEPRLITEFNHLNIQLIGHYTQGCEDPASSALWATVSNASTLDLTFASLATKPELGCCRCRSSTGATFAASSCRSCSPRNLRRRHSKRRAPSHRGSARLPAIAARCSPRSSITRRSRATRSYSRPMTNVPRASRCPSSTARYSPSSIAKRPRAASSCSCWAATRAN
jgi:hypothetical protein